MHIPKNVYYTIYVITIVFNLIVVAISFYAIFPIANGNITVEIPEASDIYWTWDEDVVTLNAPLNVINRGIYEIEDLTISINVKNDSHDFMEYSQSFPAIPSKDTCIVTVEIPLDITEIYNMEMESGLYHFYNYDDFNLELDFSVSYAMDLVHFRAEYVKDINWEPIIKDMETHQENTEFFENDSYFYVDIPFSIDTASYLFGTLEVEGDIYNESSSYIGTTSTEIDLGGLDNSYFHFSIDKDLKYDLLVNSQPLLIKTKMMFGGLLLERDFTYQWHAPLEDLWINASYNSNNLTLNYSFINDYETDLNIDFNIDVYDINNVTIGTITEEYLVENSEQLNETAEILLTTEPDHLFIEIEIIDKNSGLSYTIEIPVGGP